MFEINLRNKPKEFAAEERYKPLQNDCGSIRRMLISSINTAKKNIEQAVGVDSG